MGGEILYSIGNFKKLGELQEEYDLLKSEKEELLKNKVQPAMKDELNALFRYLKLHFTTNGLEIHESSNSYVAQYKSATIAVEIINDGFALMLKINSREIDEISVSLQPCKYSAPKEVVNPDELEVEITDLQNKIQDEKGLLQSCRNLQIQFTNKNNQIFKAKEEVIKKYFTS